MKWLGKLNQYGSVNKTLIAVVTAAIGWGNLVVASKPGPITAGEWMTGATYLGIALGVYQVTNGTAPKE